MTVPLSSAYIADDPEDLPDFMIVGAMKCGSTTLQTILNRHPRIFIPAPEINFFSADDVINNYDFWFYRNRRWLKPDIANDPPAYWRWYRRFFEHAPATALRGEDSTGYLASQRALERIAQQPKPIKLIVCLRHPTDRTYSQYWHMLRRGRAIYNFEDTLRLMPNDLLWRSQYARQIETLLRVIPRERIFFWILEDYLRDPKQTIDDVLRFIGADSACLDHTVLERHQNKAKNPRSIRFALWKNRLIRPYLPSPYQRHFGLSDTHYPFSDVLRSLSKRVDRLNLLPDIKTPAMRAETRQFLNAYFQREFAGLNEQVGFDLENRWFG